MSGGDGDGGDGDTTGEKEFKPRTKPAPESSGRQSEVVEHAGGGAVEVGEGVDEASWGLVEGGVEQEGEGELGGGVGEEVGGRLKEQGGGDVCGAEPRGGDVLYPRIFI